MNFIDSFSLTIDYTKLVPHFFLYYFNLSQKGNLMRFCYAFQLMVVFYFFLVIPSFGYVDPGAGHFIWQSLMAAFFGGFFFLRRFTGFFSKNKKEENR